MDTLDGQDDLYGDLYGDINRKNVVDDNLCICVVHIYSIYLQGSNRNVHILYPDLSDLRFINLVTLGTFHIHTDNGMIIHKLAAGHCICYAIYPFCI